MNINENVYNVFGDEYIEGNDYIYIGFKKYNSDNEKSVINNSISLVTKSKYIHTELIYVNNQENKFMMMSASQFSDEVRVIEHKLNKSWDYYRMKVNKYFLRNMFNFFMSIEGCQYDYMGVLGFVLLNQDRSDRWFCSEFCSNVLKINGFEPMWCIEPSNTSPGKLADMLNIPNKIKRIELIKEMLNM